MCAKYGVKLYKTECSTLPGQVIYEDDFQIAVINEVEGLEVVVKELNEDEKNFVHTFFGNIDNESANKMLETLKDCRKSDKKKW